VIEYDSGDEEAQGVCTDISRRIAAGASPREIAVFYRINAMSRVMEEALLRCGVAYQIARGIEFYNRKEIKDVLAYLRVLHNPADDVALLRILNTPARGIGDTTVDRLSEEARRRNCPLLALIRSEGGTETAGRSAAKVQQFVQLLDQLARGLSLPPHEAIDFVVSHSGLHALYHNQHSDEGSPLDNIVELVNAAAEFHERNPDATVQSWLEHTALLSDIDAVRDQGGTITLMTLHAAKGLEFDDVYLLGLEDGLLPFYRGDGADTDLEEERRLAFVGITRARKHLTLTHARFRMTRGITERTVTSPFLDELPPQQIEWSRSDHDESWAKSRRKDELPDDIAEWSIGTIVRHPLHGIGQIRNIVQSGRRTHVDVVFKRGGPRTMILEFAQLERVDFDEVD
jgi:DNA helicase-2/ATP-dependent DNA helicase PcrA